MKLSFLFIIALFPGKPAIHPLILLDQLLQQPLIFFLDLPDLFRKRRGIP